MTIELSQTIHAHTDNRLFITRIVNSGFTISKKLGCVKASLMVAGMTSAKVFLLAMSYFALEGSARSLMEIYEGEDVDSIVRIRPLGDAGGWTALVLFSLLTAGSLLAKFTREGEYLKLKPICKKWIQDNQEFLKENPQFHATLYKKIQTILDGYNSQCLFSKRLVSRRIKALQIYKKSIIDQSEEKLEEKPIISCKDADLTEVFIKVQGELEEATSTKHYFHRLYEGQKSIAKVSIINNCNSIILGVALPIIFLLCAIISMTGEFGLGKELFVDREELGDTGHFGEWPFNAVESVIAAFFLHIWCMINEGDFALTRKVYTQNLKSLEDNPLLHNRLRKLANAELLQNSLSCYHFRSPLDTQFEKI